MIRPTSVAVVALLCAACGGGGATPDVEDVPDAREDWGEADVGADADTDDDGELEVDGGADADADGDDDAGDVADVPDDGDADVPEASKRSVLAVTAGGGTARGGSYGLTLSIGTPQPMGTGTSSGFHGAFGPGAVQGQ